MQKRLQIEHIANSAENDKSAFLEHGQQTSQMTACFAPADEKRKEKQHKEIVGET